MTLQLKGCSVLRLTSQHVFLELIESLFSSAGFDVTQISARSFVAAFARVIVVTMLDAERCRNSIHLLVKRVP